MTQKLQFEPAWDRTISAKDRNEIKQTFDSFVAKLPDAGIHFSPLWQATNHQDNLLLTVLIHHCDAEPFAFRNPVMQYRLGTIILARHTCDFSYTIPGKTSMPWTFIFPKGTYSEQAMQARGVLEIAAQQI